MGNVDSVQCLAMTDTMKMQHKVQLAVTPLGSHVPSMAQAYHTSIAVDGIELSFSRKGINTALSFESHAVLPQGPGEVFDMGTSPMGIPQLMNALRPFFQKNEYDLLRKNCNTFSDCALFFLMGKRLDHRYCGLERLGASVEENIGLVGIVSYYTPNPRADGFNIEEIVKTFEVLSQMHKGWVVDTVTSTSKTGTVTMLYENEQLRAGHSAPGLQNMMGRNYDLANASEDPRIGCLLQAGEAR